MKKSLFFILVLTLFSCRSTLVLVGGKHLASIDKPEELHKGLADIKVTTEEVGRLIKDYYNEQDKDDSYNNLFASYNEIKSSNQRLIEDISIRIKKGLDVKLEDYQERINGLNDQTKGLKNLYSESIAGLSDSSIGGIIKKIGLDIIRKLAKEQALRLYAKAFVKEYSIINFEKIRV